MWTDFQKFLEDSGKQQLIKPIREAVVSSDINLKKQQLFYESFYQTRLPNYNIIISLIHFRIDKATREVNLSELDKVKDILMTFLSQEKRQYFIENHKDYLQNNDPIINLDIIQQKNKKIKVKFYYNVFKIKGFQSNSEQNRRLARVDQLYCSSKSQIEYQDLFLSEYVNFWIFHPFMFNRVKVFDWYLSKYSENGVFPNLKNRITILDRMGLKHSQISFFECLLDHGFKFVKRGQLTGDQIMDKVKQELREKKDTKYLYYKNAPRIAERKKLDNVTEWWKNYENNNQQQQ